MKPDYKSLLESILKRPKSIKKTFKSLQKLRKGNVDALMHKYHEKAFETIDCLECANCCTTTGPMVNQKDIDRIARFLKLKPLQFIEKYLRLDENNDYVFKVMPCIFLGANNRCQIYEVRPKACREYPHTDRVNQLGILSVTQKNAKICPAVAQIILTIESDMNAP